MKRIRRLWLRTRFMIAAAMFPNCADELFSDMQQTLHRWHTAGR